MSLLELFFSFRGRVLRADFWYAVLVVASVFVVLFVGLESTVGRTATWILYPPLYWSLFALMIQRHHDIGRSGWWLLLLLIPIIGPIWIAYSLFFRKGQQIENQYGAVPYRQQLDYLVVPKPGDSGPCVINDVTELNPVEVTEIVEPHSVADIQAALAKTKGTVSIGGGHFSMGGQTAAHDSLHLDLRGFNRVLHFCPEVPSIRVQSGARWCDLQRFLDPHGLSVKIMQTYANFTVGGSLSVNAHGRYVGLGPTILSVREITLVLADGRVVTASPTENNDLFYGAIGGYGGLGIIAEVELDVTPNIRVTGECKTIATSEYPQYFQQSVRDDPQAVFHNADMYPPHYSRVRSMTWVETDKRVTQTSRLHDLRSNFPLERYFFWAISETPTGKWRREYLIDPLLFFRKKVHWRNYEASYDVAELEPASRRNATYVLQEYFVPVGRFQEFVPAMAEIFQRHNVNIINVSIRHAFPDPGSLLAWAREEVFAFVVYYKQGTAQHDCGRVAVWTREMIDAVLAVDGTYYLPYQPHATAKQFHQAYPRAQDFFALKSQYDPEYRFRNSLWDKYYSPIVEPAMSTQTSSTQTSATDSEFRQVFGTTEGADAMYRFLQNVFHLYPEDRFHALIADVTRESTTDQAIYEAVQQGLPKIKPFLSELTYALPALKKQKREMARQTLELLGARKSFDGYLEIGSTGRYISVLRKEVEVTGPIYLTNDIAPGNGPGDIMERGQFKQIGTFFPLDYAPLDTHGIAPGSLDLVTCFIGLHHAPADKLEEFVRSIHRCLRPEGVFIMRDHDAGSEEMQVFCSLVHTVFNLGLNVSWQDNAAEYRSFRSAEDWSAYVVERGFRDLGPRLLQANDPSDNTLMGFVRQASGASA